MTAEELASGSSIKDKMLEMCPKFNSWDDLYHERPNVQPHAISSSMDIRDYSDSDSDSDFEASASVDEPENESIAKAVEGKKELKRKTDEPIQTTPPKRRTPPTARKDFASSYAAANQENMKNQVEIARQNIKAAELLEQQKLDGLKELESARANSAMEVEREKGKAAVVVELIRQGITGKNLADTLNLLGY